MRRRRIGFALLLALASCRATDDRESSDRRQLLRARDQEQIDLAAKRGQPYFGLGGLLPTDQQVYNSRLRK